MNAMCRSAVRANYAACGSQKMESQHVGKPIRQNAELRTVGSIIGKPNCPTVFPQTPIWSNTRNQTSSMCERAVTHFARNLGNVFSVWDYYWWLNMVKYF